MLIEEEILDGGGGATDVRLMQGSWNDSRGLKSRIIVAAGGAGGNHSDNNSTYLAGGGISSFGHFPANQSGAGNGAGFGYGTSVNANSGYPNGGGGGGWFGGGGITGGRSAYQASSGGSGYVLTSSSYKPGGYIPDSKYYFSNATIKSGVDTFPSPSGGNETGHSGHGYARISLVEE